MSNISKAALLYMSCIALTGCSFFADFYVVNNSDKSVTAIIRYEAPIDLIKDSNTKLSLYYADTTFLVNDETRNLLTKKLPYTLTNSNTITLNIPEHSTVLIGGTYSRAIAAESLKFVINGSTREYTQQTIPEHLKKSGGLFPPFHFTYTIED